jgi:hypothetical protein
MWDNHPMQSQLLKRWLPLAAFCLIGVPVIIYLFGGLLVGPYQGEGGLPGMVGTIYLDAIKGHLSALTLLTAPVLLIGIWVSVMQLRRHLPGSTLKSTQGQ